MGYPVKAIANYFIGKYGKNGITPLKLQKLVYLAHGWHYAFKDDPLVDDEFAEAWEYGPVFPSLYHEFKHRGNRPIMDFATEIDYESVVDPDADIIVKTPQISDDDTFTQGLLDRIWEKYGPYTGVHLSDLTHRQGSPWQITRSRMENASIKNVNIENEEIKKYYKNRVRGNKS